MSGTWGLRSEHAGVSRMLSIMDGMSERARTGTPPEVADLEQVIEFLKVLVGQRHRSKEESLLFPAMR